MIRYKHVMRATSAGGWLSLASIALLVSCAPEKAPYGPALEENAQAIRAKAVEGLESFLKLSKPDFQGFPDKIGDLSGLAHAFLLSRQRALIALVWAGEPNARREVEGLVEGVLGKGRGHWRGYHGFFYRRFRFPTMNPVCWPADREFHLLTQALDRHRPELARGLRRKALEAQARQSHPAPPYFPMEMTAEQVEFEVKEGGHVDPARVRWLMRHWMMLAPVRARPFLAKVMESEPEGIHRRCAAAAALAASGDMEGLAWLRDACVMEVRLGAEPALDLIRAGEKGWNAYALLLSEHDGPNMPPPLVESILYCPESSFLDHLPVFLNLDHPAGRTNVEFRIGEISLSGGALGRVLAYIRLNPAQSTWLIRPLLVSLAYHPPTEQAARGSALLWVDGMVRNERDQHWPDLAQLYLSSHLASPELMARSARHALDDPLGVESACDVLAEIGKHEDVPGIWSAIEQNNDPSYSIRTRGWFAIIRLTSNGVN